MFALLLKDWLVTRTATLLSVVVVVAFNLWNFSRATEAMPPSVLPLSFMILAYIVVPLSFYHDEKSHVLQFAFSAPLQRKDYARSKYIVGLALALAGTLVSIPVYVWKVQMPWDWALLAGAAGFFVIQMLPSLMLPFFFRFGMEKGRIVMVILYMLLFFSFTLAKKATDFMIPWLDSFARLPLSLLAALLFGAGLAMSFLSVKISERIVEAKEA